MRGIHELENAYRRRLEELPAGAVDGELSEVPWLLEELRISQFAQAIGPRGQVSARSIRRILDEAAVNDERPAPGSAGRSIASDRGDHARAVRKDSCDLKVDDGSVARGAYAPVMPR